MQTKFQCDNCGSKLEEFNNGLHCISTQCDKPIHILLPSKTDPVNPDHYKQGGVECIDAIKAALTPEQYIGFLRGTQIKYLWRAGRKDPILQDLKKAEWYMKKEMEAQSVNPA
jgi:hypothetical protein